MDEELELPSNAPEAPPAEAEVVLPSDDPNMVLPSDAPKGYWAEGVKPTSRLGHAAATVADIPHKIYKAGEEAVGGLNERFNPWSKTQTELQKKQLDPNTSILDRMADEWGNIKSTGSGLLSAPAAVLSPVTGTARSVVGHGFDAVRGHQTPEDIEKYKKVGITPITGDEVGDLASMGIAPGKGGLRTLHGPAEPPPVAPLPPEKPPFGITLTEGEQTGKLPLIQKEQAALRGKEILGEPAHEQAQQFRSQREHELPAAKEAVAGELNPTSLRVDSPQVAADRITDILTQQHRAREATTAQRTQQLQDAHNAFRQAIGPESGMVLAETPVEAANIIGGSIIHANDAAKAATNAAYTAAREMPGKFPAASFNTLEAEIRGTLARGNEPKIINPQQHPTTVSALGDIEDILSDLKQMRDPETGRVLPKPPNTMERVDHARQRLNTFLGDAISTARNDSSAWKDVRALEDVIDAFDAAVAKRLRKGQFIGGDAQAVDAAFKEARALHADWAKKFKPQGAGDKVGPAIRDILGRHEGQAATPEAVQNFLYGSGDRPVFVAKRLKQIYGVNSHEVAAARQGLYSHITEPPPGKTWTPEQVAANIEKYTRGAGRSLTEEYFSRPQINALQSFAEAQRVHARGLAAKADPADAIIAQLTGATTGSAPSTQYAVQTLFQKALSNSKDAIATIERLKQRLSPEQFGMYREGLYRTAVEQGMGLEGYGHKKIADNLTKLANSQAGRATYSPAQQEMLRQFAGVHRKMIVPQSGANWSNTANTAGMAVNLMSKTSSFVLAALGELVSTHMGLPGVGMGAYVAGKTAQKLANNAALKQITKQMPLVADKLNAYNKAVAAYNKSQNPLSTRAQVTAGANLSRALQQIGIDPSKLALPGVSRADEKDQKERAEGGAVEAAPFDEGSLPREGFYDGRYHVNVAPGLQPLQAANKPYEPPVDLENTGFPSEGMTPNQWDAPPSGIQPDQPTFDFGKSKLGRVANMLTGAGGEERYQLWPEKLVRSGFTLPSDVAAGKVPTHHSTISDDPNAPDFVGNAGPVGTVDNLDLIHRAQDLAGMAGGTGFGAAATGAVPQGALGMIGGKGLVPAIKQGRKVWVGDKDMPFHSDVWEQKVVPDVGLKQADADGTIHGFVNEKGKFLTREQAAAYADKNSLLTREGKSAVRQGYDDLDASDVRPKALFSDSGKPGAPLAALERTRAPEMRVEQAPIGNLPAPYQPAKLGTDIQNFLQLSKSLEQKYGANWAEKLSTQELAAVKEHPSFVAAASNLVAAKAAGALDKLLQAPMDRRELFRGASMLAGAVANASRVTKMISALEPAAVNLKPAAYERITAIPTEYKAKSGEVMGRYWRAERELRDARDQALAHVEDKHARELIEGPFKAREAELNQNMRAEYDALYSKNAEELAAERAKLDLPKLNPEQQRVLDYLVDNRPVSGDFTDSRVTHNPYQLTRVDEFRAMSPERIEQAGRYYDNDPGFLLSRMTPEQNAQIAEHLKPAMLQDPHLSLRDARTIANAFPSLKGFALMSDSGKPGAPLAALENAKPFYSAVERAIEKAPQDKMTPQQWAGWLKNQPGIKGEELNWLGLGDNPRGITPDWKGTVTKDELLGHVKEHGVELKDVEKGGGARIDEDALGTHADMLMREWQEHTPELDPHINQDGGLHFARDTDGNVLGVGNTSLEAKRNAERLIKDIREGDPDVLMDASLEVADQTLRGNKSATKYHDWQLPGGENYREMLVTLPEKRPPIPEGLAEAAQAVLKKGAPGEYGPRLENWGSGWSAKAVGDKWLAEGRISKPEYDALLEYDNRHAASKGLGEHAAFSTNHWDEPNVVGHMRMNDREIPGVGKSMHVEEFQSDWGQQGRKHGYKGDWAPENVKTVEWDPKTGVGTFAFKGKEYTGMGESQLEAKQWMLNQLEGTTEFTKQSVSDMPFKTSWPDMLLKRAITKAAREGYDSVSWTPGDQQAARYDLSKQVDEIHVIKANEAGTEFMVTAKPKGSRQMVDVGPDTIPKDKLADYVGKEMAAKIAEQKENSHSYEGVDLKVGGDGMKAFYDKMLVDKANAIGKKFGAKVEWKELPGEVITVRKSREGWEFYRNGEYYGGTFDAVSRKTALERAMEHRAPPVKVPVLRLTPELKAQALQGMPLFQDSGKVGSGLSALEKQPFGKDPYFETYHGTLNKFRATKNNPFGKFNLSHFGEGTGADQTFIGNFTTNKPSVADVYAGDVGYVYKAALRGDPKKNYMDVDKRLSQQAPAVREALKTLDAPEVKALFAKEKNPYVVDVYEALAIKRDPSDLMDTFRNAGIYGVVGKEHGSNVYTTFDPVDMHVLDRRDSGGFNKKRAAGGSVLGDDDYEDERQEMPGPESEEPDDDADEEPQERALGGRVEARNINHAPTEAQKHVGNYAKDHVNIHGLKIAIENARGSKRRGVDKNGEPWECKVPCNYGYIKGTHGADDDHVDVYLGPHLKAPQVFILDQVDKDTKKFDEHKVGIGFGSKAQFISTYKRAFSDGKGQARIGAIAELPIEVFKAWLSKGDTTKPLGWH